MYRKNNSDGGISHGDRFRTQTIGYPVGGCGGGDDVQTVNIYLPYPSVNPLLCKPSGYWRVKSERYRTWERAANNMLLAQPRKTFAATWRSISRSKRSITGRDVANLERHLFGYP